MLEFMTISGHAKCAAALIAMLSLAERSAIKMLGVDGPRSFVNWAAVLDFARNTNIRSQSGDAIPVFEYLSTASQPRQRRMVRSKSRSPRDAISELIQRVASHYFREGSALRKAQQQFPHDSHPELAFFDFLYGLTQTKNEKGEHFYAATVRRLEEDNRDNDTVFMEFAKTCCGEFQDIDHIDFPSIPLLSIDAIQAEFHGVLSEEENRLRYPSLFAVIREARGWTTEEGSQNYVNAVLRDIIWVQDPNKAATVGNTSEGLYYSVLDTNLYIANIERDQLDSRTRRPNILINADMSELGNANHFYMFFPLVNQRLPLWVEDGVIAGTAKNVDQLAAWKILLIQPDWGFSQRLETMLFILFKRRDYTGITRLLTSSGVCTQLFNQGKVGIAESEACRDAFRRLLFPSNIPASIDRALGGRLRTSMTNAFQQTLSESVMRLLGEKNNLSDFSGTVPGIVDKLISNIEEEITSRWHLIEPAQIMTFLDHTGKARKNLKRAEIDGLIAALLRLLPSAGS